MPATPRQSDPDTSRPVRPAGDSVRITEIFYSLQGEARTVGCPTVFIRLTGCPLRCTYCDTEYAFTGGERRSLDDILRDVSAYAPRYVCVTGGEPLAQPECRTLLTYLADAGYDVSLETSGALDIGGIDPRVSIVMDVKTPGSGEADRNLVGNIPRLKPTDQVKFVLRDRTDYEWSRALLRAHDLPARCDVLFSPVHGELDAATLADWILADRLRVRLQIQLHKLLWDGAPGR